MIYKPSYHFTPGAGYLNDPNGPCFWGGQWHLFYQHFIGGTTVWGHAVSDNLVVWKELPDAITPTTEKACWSGVICIKSSFAVAAYYGHEGECGIYCAVSSDPLLCEWTPVKDGPVILSADLPFFSSNGKPYDSVPYTVPPMLYDPFIWYEDGMYFILSAGIHENAYTGGVRREEYLFKSADLIHWQYQHPFIDGEAYSEVGDDGGCPYFIPIAGRHLLLHYSHKNGPRYVLGYYDHTRMKFIPSSGERINTVTQTSGYFAPAAWSDPSDPSSVLAVYVMHGHRAPAVMSLIHRLRLCGEAGDFLSVEPAADFAVITSFNTRRYDICVSAGETVLDICGRCAELDITIEHDEKTSPELRLFRSPDGDEYVSLKLYPSAGSKIKKDGIWLFTGIVTLVTDRSDPGLPASPPEILEIPYNNNAWTTRIFLDHSVIEAFFPGARSIGRRVFPSPESTGISVVSDRGVCRVSIDFRSFTDE